MTISKASLVDTNVLIYAADESSQYHKVSKELRDKAIRGELHLCVFPQIIYEFFAVITDPRRVANPRSHQEAVQEIENYYKAPLLLKLYPGPDVIDITIELLKRYEVRKQEVFDLQLVATMISNGIRRIYTFNHEHFRKYTEIETVEP